MLEIIKENICEGLQCNLSDISERYIDYQKLYNSELYICERGFVIQKWNGKLRFNCLQYTGSINNWKGKYISKILPYNNDNEIYSVYKVTNHNKRMVHRDLIIKNNNNDIILQLHFINYNKLNIFLSWLLLNSNWNVYISKERSDIFGNNL